jgi:hypothetical protein
VTSGLVLPETRSRTSCGQTPSQARSRPGCQCHIMIPALARPGPPRRPHRAQAAQPGACSESDTGIARTPSRTPGPSPGRRGRARWRRGVDGGIRRSVLHGRRKVSPLSRLAIKWTVSSGAARPLRPVARPPRRAGVPGGPWARPGPGTAASASVKRSCRGNALMGRG